MNATAPLYTKLLSTNGAVSLMRTDSPGLPTFGVIAADGELLDTFTRKAAADEFYNDAQDRIRKDLPWPDPDAPAFSTLRKEDGTPALSRCGCIAGSCFCGLYPTAAEWSAMQAEADADLPQREALTVAEEIEAEELRNFFGRRQDA